MDTPVIQQQILTAFQQAEHIIIHRHQHPDPDALGSQAGLAAVLRHSFPGKTIQVVGEDPGNLAWLATMDTVSDAAYRDALVVVTDTADTPRVSDERFTKGTGLIKIDHHPNDDPYGEINWVVPTASSTSELICDLVAASNGLLSLDDAAARLLYAGIVGDTGRFLFNNTSSHTLRVAADLISYEFSPDHLNNQMNQITLGQARLQGYVFEHLTVTPAGAATVTIPLSEIHRLGLSADEVHAAVGTPGRLGAVQAWALFVEQEEGPYRVHLRSKGPIINGLAKAHNGGGHDLASGAKAADTAEIKQITEELAAIVAEGK